MSLSKGEPIEQNKEVVFDDFKVVDRSVLPWLVDVSKVSRRGGGEVI